jgi:uncharacterized protein
MAISRAFLDLAVCPKCKQPVVYFEAEGCFVCPAERLRYRIDAGVPVLLADEATEVSAAEMERLLAQAKELGLPGA